MSDLTPYPVNVPLFAAPTLYGVVVINLKAGSAREIDGKSFIETKQGGRSPDLLQLNREGANRCK
jgi:hypothetical protein